MVLLVEVEVGTEGSSLNTAEVGVVGDRFWARRRLYHDDKNQRTSL
jgi:hypothetical protein